MGKKEDIKAKVSIPMYFYNVIVPQLGSYYNDYPVDFDVRPVACCPLHDEDTPSMRYYEETNTFYCFGCRAGGDVLQLHRLFTERQTGTLPSLDESVEYLYNFFIKGNDKAGIKLTPKLVSEEPLSTPIELARYSSYTSVLEKQINIDKSIPEESKRELWEALDMVDLLIEKNQINAKDGEQYIKEKVLSVIS